MSEGLKGYKVYMGNANAMIDRVYPKQFTVLLSLSFHENMPMQIVKMYMVRMQKV